MLSNEVVTNIVKAITSSAFFSIITDTTQDISTCDQLTYLIRYVTIYQNDLNVPVKTIIHESFLGFHEVIDQHSNNLVEQILICLHKLG